MIYKHVFEVIVLTEDAPDYDPDDLQAIAYDIDEGDCIGNYTRVFSIEVPPDQVKQELIAIGNDGTFFDSWDE